VFGPVRKRRLSQNLAAIVVNFPKYVLRGVERWGLGYEIEVF
jgi:hypothetical protein